MKTIALSAGHSDSDPGAVYNGLVERDLVEIIVKDASDILRSHGVGVLNPPSSLNLTKTIAWINARKAQTDLCCEIHVNSSGKPNQGVGLEGWYYHNSEVSKKFSDFMIDAISVESGMSKDRGSKDEGFNRWGKLGFVHYTVPLACLIECGFINTDVDRKILSSESGLYDIAKGVARGVVSYLGIKWEPPKPQNEQETQELSQIRTNLAGCKDECQRLKERLNQISIISKL